MSNFINNIVIRIDVATDFSIVTILTPNGETYMKLS